MSTIAKIDDLLKVAEDVAERMKNGKSDGYLDYYNEYYKCQIDGLPNYVILLDYEKSFDIYGVYHYPYHTYSLRFYSLIGRDDLKFRSGLICINEDIVFRTKSYNTYLNELVVNSSLVHELAHADFDKVHLPYYETLQELAKMEADGNTRKAMNYSIKAAEKITKATHSKNETYAFITELEALLVYAKENKFPKYVIDPMIYIVSRALKFKIEADNFINALKELFPFYNLDFSYIYNKEVVENLVKSYIKKFSIDSRLIDETLDILEDERREIFHISKDYVYYRKLEFDEKLRSIVREEIV